MEQEGVICRRYLRRLLRSWKREHCTKYGNKDVEQQNKSYSTMIMYEVADLVDDLIEIVKQEAEQYEECYKDCGDCEAYNKEKHHCPKFCNVIKETVKEIEENHNDWISCSERLPEESGEYLTWVEYDGDRFIAIDEIDCDGIIKEWNCSTDYKIIAWQPLPQPYQPKGE